MRRALILGIVFFTIFSTLTAAASSLMINGGTIQSFIYEANVPSSKSQPMQKRENIRPPTSRTIPELSIRFTEYGVNCNGDNTISVGIINNSTEILHATSWELYLDGEQIEAGSLPTIKTQDVYTITLGFTLPGIYQIILGEKVDQNPVISNRSEEIIVNENNCPHLFVDIATATLHSIEVTVQVSNQITSTPFLPAPTSIPDQNTSTVQPSPTTIPQTSPTQTVPTLTQSDDPTATISPTAANSPDITEDTSAVDPTQTQTMISSSP